MSLRRIAPVFVLTALLSGCAGSAANTPKAEVPDARTARKEKREEPPVLIAPPPAYGNKIVMASFSRP